MCACIVITVLYVYIYIYIVCSYAVIVCYVIPTYCAASWHDACLSYHIVWYRIVSDQLVPCYAKSGVS